MLGRMVDENVSARCRDWRRMSRKVETCVGYMFLCMLQCFEGLDEERVNLRVVVELPVGLRTSQEVVDALTKWIDRYDVCQEYVADTPDWGVMQSQLSHLVEPLDRMSTAFGYARNKYVDDQGLALYEQANKEKFVMYINQILSLIKLFGPMSQSGEGTQSRAYVSGTQEVKICPLFRQRRVLKR